jgi:hypothetical protein
MQRRVLFNMANTLQLNTGNKEVATLARQNDTCDYTVCIMLQGLEDKAGGVHGWYPLYPPADQGSAGGAVRRLSAGAMNIFGVGTKVPAKEIVHTSCARTSAECLVSSVKACVEMRLIVKYNNV